MTKPPFCPSPTMRVSQRAHANSGEGAATLAPAMQPWHCKRITQPALVDSRRCKGLDCTLVPCRSERLPTAASRHSPAALHPRWLGGAAFAASGHTNSTPANMYLASPGVCRCVGVSVCAQPATWPWAERETGPTRFCLPWCCPSPSLRRSLGLGPWIHGHLTAPLRPHGAMPVPAPATTMPCAMRAARRHSIMYAVNRASRCLRAMLPACQPSRKTFMHACLPGRSKRDDQPPAAPCCMVLRGKRSNWGNCTLACQQHAESATLSHAFSS